MTWQPWRPWPPPHAVKQALTPPCLGWACRNAGSAIKELEALAAPSAQCKRDGEWQKLPVRELVPGDLVALKGGDVIPADCQVGWATCVATGGAANRCRRLACLFFGQQQGWLGWCGWAGNSCLQLLCCLPVGMRPARGPPRAPAF